MNDFFSTFGRAFWSPLAYKNALAWRWKLLAYFLLLALFSSLIMSYPVSKVFDRELTKMFDTIESFEVIDGNVKTKDGEPLRYDVDGLGMLYVGETPNDSNEVYLISVEGNTLSVATDSMPVTFDLSDFTMGKDVIVDKTYVQDMMSILIIPMLFISILISNFFFVSVLTVASYVMLMTSPLRVGFIGGLKISVLAITPMTFFQSVGSFFSLQDSAGFLYGLISIILVWYVIKKLPDYYSDTIE